MPRPCKKKAHAHRKRIPRGLTHKIGEACLFEVEDFPKGILTTCCSLRGKIAARELEALGETDLSNAMYSDMTCEEAAIFSARLRATADLLEFRNKDIAKKPRGAGWDGTLNAEKNGWDWTAYSTFEEALASIRQAARWYEAVGRLGFGVHAWS